MKYLIVGCILLIFFSCSKKESSTKEETVKQNSGPVVDQVNPKETSLFISDEIVSIKSQIETSSGSLNARKVQDSQKSLVAGLMLEKALSQLNLNTELQWDELDENNINKILNTFFDENFDLKK